MTDRWDPAFCARHAWFAPLAATMARFSACEDWPSPELCTERVARADRLLTFTGLPVRFAEVPAPSRRARRARNVTPYDRWIFEQGLVPTRARNWHDFFNVLVWGSFPAAKRAVNARQYEALRARDRMGTLPRGVRTREQDALAMLDEGGLLCLTHPCAAASARDAVDRADPEALAVLERTPHVRSVLFGHAVYEHLVVARGPVRAMTVVLPTDDDTVDLGDDPSTTVRHADAALAAQLLGDPAFCAAPANRPAMPVWISH